ncbi:hypothetical protein EVAR_14897_1 [Eumeta japonica]|uniref:Uncharacterized protein n=1 Tax=Eumeta variegata TaxID=151549 RepID=A0A4C1V4B3_EUMVA|nr:hypothetical protein EVAR_14897_1 [Eumeta japonica]
MAHALSAKTKSHLSRLFVFTLERRADAVSGGGRVGRGNKRARGGGTAPAVPRRNGGVSPPRARVLISQQPSRAFSAAPVRTERSFSRRGRDGAGVLRRRGPPRALAAPATAGVVIGV